MIKQIFQKNIRGACAALVLLGLVTANIAGTLPVPNQMIDMMHPAIVDLSSIGGNGATTLICTFHSNVAGATKITYDLEGSMIAGYYPQVSCVSGLNCSVEGPNKASFWNDATIKFLNVNFADKNKGNQLALSADVGSQYNVLSCETQKN